MTEQDRVIMALTLRLIPQAGRNVNYSANWTGAWDRADSIDAVPITINKGKGFECALRVSVPEGQFIYFGPFEVETQKPHERVMFTCQGALFIKNI